MKNKVITLESLKEKREKLLLDLDILDMQIYKYEIPSESYFIENNFEKYEKNDEFIFTKKINEEFYFVIFPKDLFLSINSFSNQEMIFNRYFDECKELFNFLEKVTLSKSTITQTQNLLIVNGKNYNIGKPDFLKEDCLEIII